MKAKNKNNTMYDVYAELDSVFGALGTESRRAADDLAWQEYNAQILLDARRNSGLTQQALAERIGSTKGGVAVELRPAL